MSSPDKKRGILASISMQKVRRAMGGYQCCACGEVFHSDYAFRKHQTGDYGHPIYRGSQIVGYTPSGRRCLSGDEMVARGMVKNKRGRWITEQYERSELVAM